MEPLSPQSTRDILVSALRNAILSGDFLPGKALTQDMIAEQFGVSRMPVRQALEILAIDGLITCYPNKSATVNQIDETFICEYFEIRRILEGTAFQNACIYLMNDPQAESDLKAIIREGDLSSEYQDYKAFNLYNYKFHQYFWNHCGSERLRLMVSRLWYSMNWTVPEKSFDANSYTSHEQHIKIAKSVISKNHVDCNMYFNEHILTSREITLKKFHAKRTKG